MCAIWKWLKLNPVNFLSTFVFFFIRKRAAVGLEELQLVRNMLTFSVEHNTNRIQIQKTNRSCTKLLSPKQLWHRHLIILQSISVRGENLFWHEHIYNIVSGWEVLCTSLHSANFVHKRNSTQSPVHCIDYISGLFAMHHFIHRTVLSIVCVRDEIFVKAISSIVTECHLQSMYVLQLPVFAKRFVFQMIFE